MCYHRKKCFWQRMTTSDDFSGFWNLKLQIIINFMALVKIKFMCSIHVIITGPDVNNKFRFIFNFKWTNINFVDLNESLFVIAKRIEIIWEETLEFIVDEIIHDLFITLLWNELFFIMIWILKLFIVLFNFCYGHIIWVNADHQLI